MSALRAELSGRLEKSVDAHGLVVWQDTAQEYRAVASSIAPADAEFEAYDGSWYELRRRIEPRLQADTPPRLVVYVPAAPPPEDPLEEIRSAGHELVVRLATLIRRALEGQLTEARLATLGRQSRDLEDAEAALNADAQAPVRLVRLVGTPDTARMLARALSGAYDDRLDADDGWEHVAHLAGATLGGTYGRTGPEIVGSVFRQALLSSITYHSGGLPPALRPAWHAASAEQQQNADEVLDQLLGDPHAATRYRELARAADQELELEQQLPWEEGLAPVMTTPALEALAFRFALRRLEDGAGGEARQFAEYRLAHSPWARPGAPMETSFGPRWRALARVASLRDVLAEASPPGGTPAELLTWYADVGWRVDREQRRVELARSELSSFGELEGFLTSARRDYDSWLDATLKRFSAALADHPLEAPGLRQTQIHERFVAPANGLVAYVWVDAFRYELGVELVEALRGIASHIRFEAALATPPTLTSVGMAALTPQAARELRVELNSKDQLRVRAGSTEVAGVPVRLQLLRAAHGKVTDIELNDAAQMGEQALGRAIEGADLVLLRSQEIDAAGESGHLSVAWSHFETVKSILAAVIGRLTQAGVQRVVVTADHGFIALGEELGPSHTVDAPAGATGVVKRRVFVGRGGTTTDATLRVDLASTGVASDLDLIVPRGLMVFRSGGGRQFFHGGLSPQELMVPVIVVDTEPAPTGQQLDIRIAFAGRRLTTGAFSASLRLDGSLFAAQADLRVVVTRQQDGGPVARVISGDRYDASRDIVTLEADASQVLTFQVTRNLDPGDAIDLRVLDARTGRELAVTNVAVGAPIVVEDSLD